MNSSKRDTGVNLPYCDHRLPIKITFTFRLLSIIEGGGGPGSSANGIKSVREDDATGYAKK